MKRIFSTVLLQVIVISAFCQTKKTTSATGEISNGHPAWVMQGNIYEVNVRQYTEEGTLNAFAKHLDRLKDMGVQTIWFMPINPISEADRKGSLGSYYGDSGEVDHPIPLQADQGFRCKLTR